MLPAFTTSSDRGRRETKKKLLMLPLSWMFVHQVTDLVDHSSNLIFLNGIAVLLTSTQALKQYLLKRSAIAS